MFGSDLCSLLTCFVSILMIQKQISKNHCITIFAWIDFYMGRSRKTIRAGQSTHAGVAQIDSFEYLTSIYSIENILPCTRNLVITLVFFQVPRSNFRLYMKNFVVGLYFLISAHLCIRIIMIKIYQYRDRYRNCWLLLIIRMLIFLIRQGITLGVLGMHIHDRLTFNLHSDNVISKKIS